MSHLNDVQGTWQFFSVDLAGDPEKTHELIDDLEACFWVMLWTAIHFLDSDAKPYHLTLFSECFEAESGAETGGRAKYQYFAKTTARISFPCKPLHDLTNKMCRYFAMYYYLQDEPEKRQQKYADPASGLLALLDEALARSDWPLADVVPNRFPSNSRPREQQLLDSLSPDAPIPIDEEVAAARCPAKNVVIHVCEIRSDVEDRTGR